MSSPSPIMRIAAHHRALLPNEAPDIHTYERLAERDAGSRMFRQKAKPASESLSSGGKTVPPHTRPGQTGSESVVQI
jgi:hypothetical protein